MYKNAGKIQIFNTDLNLINLNCDDIPEAWLDPERKIVYNQKNDCSTNESSNVFGDSTADNYLSSRQSSNEDQNTNTNVPLHNQYVINNSSIDRENNINIDINKVNKD